MRTGGGRVGRWRRSAWALAVVGCVVLLALAGVLRASGGGGGAPGVAVGAGASGGGRPDAPGRGEGGGSGDVARERGASPQPSPGDSSEGEDGLARVSERTSDLGLEEESSGIVRAYRDQGDCLLRQAGYLDLLGDVWSCTVEGPGWVDVVLVRRAEGDRGSRVRVVRLALEEWEGAYGGVE